MILSFLYIVSSRSWRRAIVYAQWAYYRIKLRNSRINAHPPLVPRSTVQKGWAYFRETTVHVQCCTNTTTVLRMRMKETKKVGKGIISIRRLPAQSEQYPVLVTTYCSWRYPTTGSLLRDYLTVQVEDKDTRVTCVTRVSTDLLYTVLTKSSQLKFIPSDKKDGQT